MSEHGRCFGPWKDEKGQEKARKAYDKNILDGMPEQWYNGTIGGTIWT